MRAPGKIGAGHFAVGAGVPRHLSENFGHGADIGEAGEGETGADEGRESKPTEVGSKSECRRSKDDQAGAEADLRSSDQRVLRLATTGKPACIHADVPPSRTVRSSPHGPRRSAVRRARLPI